MRTSYFEECHEAEAFLIGFIICVAIVALTYNAYSTINNPKEIVCRDGRLYEVYQDNNITIYNPKNLECSLPSE